MGVGENGFLPAVRLREGNFIDIGPAVGGIGPNRQVEIVRIVRGGFLRGYQNIAGIRLVCSGIDIDTIKPAIHIRPNSRIHVAIYCVRGGPSEGAAIYGRIEDAIDIDLESEGGGVGDDVINADAIPCIDCKNFGPSYSGRTQGKVLDCAIRL